MKEKFRVMDHKVMGTLGGAKRTKNNLLLEQASEIVEEYLDQGYILTLRQLYYQMVARDLMENNHKRYEAFSGIISEGRLGGYINWEGIEDRSRRTITAQSFSSTNHLLEVAMNSYRLNRMESQDIYIEVLVEKEALSGILEPIAEYYGIPFTAIKGQSSTSFNNKLAERMKGQLFQGKEIKLLYLGDMDPSGIAIPKNITNKLIEQFRGDKCFSLDRIALTIEQAEEVSAPPYPAKVSDSNFRKFVDEYGYNAYELDALSPTYLQTLTETEIEKVIDMNLFQEVLNQEKIDIVELKNKLK